MVTLKVSILCHHGRCGPGLQKQFHPRGYPARDLLLMRRILQAARLLRIGEKATFDQHSRTRGCLDHGIVPLLGSAVFGAALGANTALHGGGHLFTQGHA